MGLAKHDDMIEALAADRSAQRAVTSSDSLSTDNRIGFTTGTGIHDCDLDVKRMA
jgi:hypothetical protein